MPDQNWRANALCGRVVRKGYIQADIWHTGIGGEISDDNRLAAEICGGCQVRTACRDEAIADAQRGQQPHATILGGWIWRDSTFTAYPGDEHLMERVPGYEPGCRGGGSRRSPAALDGRLFAAARDYVTGTPADDACARHNIDKSSMRDGAVILLGAPDLVDDVESGLMTITAAMQVARSRLPEGRLQLRAAVSQAVTR